MEGRAVLMLLLLCTSLCAAQRPGTQLKIPRIIHRNYMSGAAVLQAATLGPQPDFKAHWLASCTVSKFSECPASLFCAAQGRSCTHTSSTSCMWWCIHTAATSTHYAASSATPSMAASSAAQPALTLYPPALSCYRSITLVGRRLSGTKQPC